MRGALDQNLSTSRFQLSRFLPSEDAQEFALRRALVRKKPTMSVGERYRAAKLIADRPVSRHHWRID